VPGIAFGENGEGFIRFSLTAEHQTYRVAIEATGRLFQSGKERKSDDG